MAKKKEEEVAVLMNSDQWWKLLEAKGLLPKQEPAKKPVGFDPYWFKKAA